MNTPAIKVGDAWLEGIKERNIERMTNLAEKKLSPKHYYSLRQFSDYIRTYESGFTPIPIF